MMMMLMADSKRKRLLGFVVVCFAALLFACASSAREFPWAEEIVMEQSLIQCWLQLSDIYKIVIKSFVDDMAIMPDDVEFEPRSLAKVNLQNVIYHLPRQCQNAISKCQDKPNFPLCASGEVLSAQNWHKVYPESVLGWHDTSRRQLIDHHLEIMSSVSAPSLALASAPVSALGLAPALAPKTTSEPAVASVPAPAPAPAPEISGYSPIQSSSPAPSAPETYYYTFPPETSDFDDDVGMSPLSAAVAQSEKSNSNTTAIVASVVITGAASFAFATLLFLCYNKCRRNNNGSLNGLRDDRPLLTLSMSDFSNGSSHKSSGLGSTINRDKFGKMSFKTDTNQNGHISSVEMSTVDNIPSGALPGIPCSSSAASSTLVGKPAPKLSASPPPPPAMPPPIKKVAPATPGPPPPPPKPGSHPPPPPSKPGPRPPPPPKGPRPAQAPSGLGPRKSPLGPNHSGNNVYGQEPVVGVDDNASKAKLKPFFWDKVLANPDQSMVWHQISSGSFQFNEEMIETLFGYNSVGKGKSDAKRDSSSPSASVQPVQILDPKKSQNLAILLKALNVTREEVCDAIMEGNELPNEFLQTLLKMAPTSEEELKLRLYNDDILQLGTAERFLKTLVEIPFAFKRLDALLFMGTLQEDISSIKESFTTLEIACKELRNSRLFLKLLEAVLKTGNRMNDGTYRGGAQAFKLDTLLKLADVKGTDGKTTLLLFVVQETIRSEGMRAARMARDSGSFSSVNSDDLIDDSPRESGDHYCSLGLKVVSGLGNELENVKKAAILDVDALTGTAASLGDGMVKTKEFLDKDMKSMEEDSGFYHSLKCFVEHAEIGITSLLEDEKRVRALVKSTTDYFHGNTSKDEGLRLFVIVRDFIRMLDKVCREVRQAPKRVTKAPINRETPTMQRVPDPRHLLFPAIRDQRVDTSSSDEDS